MIDNQRLDRLANILTMNRPSYELYAEDLAWLVENLYVLNNALDAMMTVVDNANRNMRLRQQL